MLRWRDRENDMVEELPKNDGAFSLLQLPKELYEKISSDSEVVFKFVGRDDEEAVLITEDKTYSVRKGETSNMQILIHSSMDEMLARHNKENRQIDDECSSCTNAIVNVMSQFELSITKPRLRNLPAYLSRYEYEGPDVDENSSEEEKSRRLSRKDLESMLQASPKEIEEELDKLGALEIDGKMCLMSQVYESQLMTLFLSTAVLNSWDFNSVTLEQCLSASDLSEYPIHVITKFFKKYTQPIESNMEIDSFEKTPRKLDINALALFRADELLSKISPSVRFTVEEFITAWTTMLPAGTTVNMDMLRGKAIAENKGGQVNDMRTCKWFVNCGSRVS
ncbi:defective in sister chromatid cohesion 1 [Guillardia theta CCMP2712]|uniref:Defective in sister chromatid cohesion 1 n=1 Tax=Guillardia theta (strain CCMP2712) TaxID=905079 RepID=L1JY29_GUITC|nr:defective in sister chromatid cohesion 1 [Guillardia theta CCMP2712]EKX52998.1 defective in sister chromatid cohesion 1 [Guillardia theta CCMP2712]|eukprot:XP_005839978.1 defective in sister chromatid cohesion 1 [Guillardia theta CCMP2712]